MTRHAPPFTPLRLTTAICVQPAYASLADDQRHSYPRTKGRRVGMASVFLDPAYCAQGCDSVRCLTFHSRGRNLVPPGR